MHMTINDLFKIIQLSDNTYTKLSNKKIYGYERIEMRQIYLIFGALPNNIRFEANWRAEYRFPFTEREN